MYLFALPDGSRLPERGAADALLRGVLGAVELQAAPTLVVDGLVCVVAGKRRDHVGLVRRAGDLAEYAAPGQSPRRWLVLPVLSIQTALAKQTGKVEPVRVAPELAARDPR